MGAGVATVGGGVALAGARGADDEAAQVERTVRQALHAALVEKDFKRACRFGSAAGRRRVLRGYNSSSGPDYASCAQIVKDEVTSPGNRFWIGRLRRNAVVTVLKVDGDRARVRVAEDSSKYAGNGHITLRKIQGKWRMTNSDLIQYGD